MSISLKEARSFYDQLNPTLRAEFADAFALSLKGRLIDGMNPEDLHTATDAAFVDAARGIGGNA